MKIMLMEYGHIVTPIVGAFIGVPIWVDGQGLGILIVMCTIVAGGLFHFNLTNCRERAFRKRYENLEKQLIEVYSDDMNEIMGHVRRYHPFECPRDEELFPRK